MKAEELAAKWQFMAEHPEDAEYYMDKLLNPEIDDQRSHFSSIAYIPLTT